jgi:hypothetical protein
MHRFISSAALTERAYEAQAPNSTRGNAAAWLSRAAVAHLYLSFFDCVTHLG